MANTITSPNMNLSLPVPGVDPGPDYALNLNASLAVIDSHNHSFGQGVQISPSGLIINTDLPFNSNNLTLARSVRFSSQTSALSGAADLGCLYESGVDLYYNDGNGNQIRLTQSGSVAGATGTITGLPSGTASAAYATGTFVFQAATNTAANIDGQSYILRNSTASSKGLTVSAPNAMAANYGLTLPSIPAGTSFVQLDTSGNLTASIPTSAGITGSNIAAQTLTQGLLALRPTGTSVAAGGTAISTSSGVFSSSSTTFTAVTNLSVTITTTGRPVMVFIQPDGALNARASISATGTTPTVNLKVLRGATVIGWEQFESSTGQTQVPSGSIRVLDTPAAGTYTYTVQVAAQTSSTVIVNNAVLVAYEI